MERNAPRLLMAAKQVVDAMYASNNEEADSHAHQEQASCRFTERIQLPPSPSPPDPAHFVGLSIRLLYAAAIRAQTNARAACTAVAVLAPCLGCSKSVQPSFSVDERASGRARQHHGRRAEHTAGLSKGRGVLVTRRLHERVLAQQTGCRWLKPPPRRRILVLFLLAARSFFSFFSVAPLGQTGPRGS